MGRDGALTNRPGQIPICQQDDQVDGMIIPQNVHAEPNSA